LSLILFQNIVITCNGQPLEVVENQLSQSLEYIYDIYIYENNESLDCDSNDYRECDDQEVDSNDENYIYNDYPDDNEVSDEVFDYYRYRDEDNDSQKDLRLNFERNRISSDYDLSEDERVDHHFCKHSSDCDSYEEFQDEDENLNSNL
jgi:hypothetical protein